MKAILVFILAVTSCAAYAEQPKGIDVIQLFFDNANLSLASEPLCNMLDAKGQSLSFKEYLSQVLSVTYETSNQITVKTFCDQSKHEVDNGETIDIWDCRMEVLEQNTKGEFISSSNIAMGISKKTMQFIPGSLRCL